MATTATKKEDKITIKLNTQVTAQWISNDRVISLYDGSTDGRPGIVSMEFNVGDLDKLPKRDLAMAFASNLIDIEGWDALEWLKSNRKTYEPPKVTTSKDIVISLSPNTTIWQSKDGTITLSILPGGKTTCKVVAGDARMAEFLYSVRTGTLMIVKSEEEGLKPMDKDPGVFFPEIERDTDSLTKAKTWLENNSVSDLVDKIRSLVPEDKKPSLNERDKILAFLKALVEVEKGKEKPREKIIEAVNRALIDLGEFVELSSQEAREKVNK